jgi:hypothetical protein
VSDDSLVALAVSRQPAGPSDGQVAVGYFDEGNLALQQHLASTLIVDLALFAAADAAHGPSIWLVEERYGAGVLHLKIFNHEIKAWVVAVDGQLGAAAIFAGVAEKKWQPRLALAFKAEEFIAQIEDVVLIAAGTVKHLYVSHSSTAGDRVGARAVA